MKSPSKVYLVVVAVCYFMSVELAINESELTRTWLVELCDMCKD